MSGTRRGNGVKAEVTAVIARNEQIGANRALKLHTTEVLSRSSNAPVNK
jgi:hypothetical protein